MCGSIALREVVAVAGAHFASSANLEDQARDEPGLSDQA